MDSPPPALHRPVLLAEAIELLNVRPEGIYIDATLGGGGHAEAILKRLDGGKLLGIDRDPVALAQAQRRLEAFAERLVPMKGNFAEIDRLHAASGLPPADGLLADLGMSSLQLEDPSRSEEHTSELQSRFDLVCRLLLEKTKNMNLMMAPRAH